MSDIKILALFQQMLGTSTPTERGVLEDVICQRLITAGLTVSSAGVLATSVAMAIAVDPLNLSSPVGPAKGGTGIANNAASTLTISGNFATTLTVSGITGVTLPTSGTLLTTTGSIAGLTGTIANATQDLITRLGTVASGVWNAGAVTSSGDFTYGGGSATNGGLVSTVANGLPVTASHASGAIRFYAGGTTLRWSVDSAGSLVQAGGTQITLDATGIGTSGSWPTTASAANANVANANYVRLVTSRRAHKRDITPIPLAEARRTMLGLQGVTYRSAVDQDVRLWAGFIADDAEAVNPTLVTYDQRGALQSFTYDRVPAYHNELLKDHEARLLALERPDRGE